jgi:hypothetical protein
MFLEPQTNPSSERSAAQIRRIRTAFGAVSKDPGDACRQMLFQAFQPQASIELEKVTISKRTKLSRHAEQDAASVRLSVRGSPGQFF